MTAVIGRRGLVHHVGAARPTPTRRQTRRKPGEKNLAHARECDARAARADAEDDAHLAAHERREARFHRARADALMARRRPPTYAEWARANPAPLHYPAER